MTFLPMPVSFNYNEWFVILSILFFFLVFLMLPKRFPWIFVVILMLLNIVLSKTSDYFLGADFPFDFYDYNDTPKLDFFDEVLQMVLYPLVGYLVNYWYDVWRKNGFSRVVFVLVVSGVTVAYEWLAAEAHVFLYKGWHLYFSFIAYLVLISTNIYFLELMKKWQKRFAEGNSR